MCKQRNINASNVITELKNKSLLLVLSFILAPLFYCPPTFAESPPTKTIGISQIVEHPALNTVRQGMLNALKEQGFEEGRNLKVLYENAQGNVVTATQIASKLLHSDPDLVVGISTPSAQTLFYEARKLEKKTPVVFTAVSDPKAAKLDSDPGYPITGITDTANLEGLLELMQIMMPQLKTLGLMYNPAETNSVSTIARLKVLLQARQIQFVEVTVNNTQDVPQATKSLIGKVDALYFPQDNTLVSAIQTVIQITSQASPILPVILPIFTSDPLLVRAGVLAAVGFDYSDVGKETGLVVAKILKGEPAQQIPIHSPKTLKAAINAKLARQLGFPIPKKLGFADVQIID